MITTLTHWKIFTLIISIPIFLSSCGRMGHDEQLVQRDRFIHSSGGLGNIDPKSLSDRMLCLIAVNPFFPNEWASGLNQNKRKFRLEAQRRGICIK